MKRRSLLSLVLLTACLAGCGGNSSSSSSETKEKLYVGLECNYAPFNWTENTKTDTNYEISGTKTYAEGYDVQVAIRIANELDKELVIKKLEWDALIPSVLEGTIDLIIAGMSPTEERKIDIDFTEPYYTSEHVLLVDSSNPYASATSVEDLAGARISGQIGTLYYKIAHAIPNVAEGNFDKDTVPKIVTDLLAGTIDGTVLELPVAQGLVTSNPSLEIVRFAEGQGFTQLMEEDGTIRDIEDTDRDVSIGLAKNREELKTSINGVLASISADDRAQIMQTAVIKQGA